MRDPFDIDVVSALELGLRRGGGATPALLSPIMTPQRFFVHGQAARGDPHVRASRTRFITDGMLDRFERVS